MKKSLSWQDIHDAFARSKWSSAKMGEKTTVVCLTLPNGFELIESSSCMDPANYIHEKGVELCLLKLKDRIWLLEGYRLQCALAEGLSDE